METDSLLDDETINESWNLISTGRVNMDLSMSSLLLLGYSIRVSPHYPGAHKKRFKLLYLTVRVVSPFQDIWLLSPHPCSWYRCSYCWDMIENNFWTTSASVLWRLLKTLCFWTNNELFSFVVNVKNIKKGISWCILAWKHSVIFVALNPFLKSLKEPSSAYVFWNGVRPTLFRLIIEYETGLLSLFWSYLTTYMGGQRSSYIILVTFRSFILLQRIWFDWNQWTCSRNQNIYTHTTFFYIDTFIPR